jgi:hypothetical protein
LLWGIAAASVSFVSASLLSGSIPLSIVVAAIIGSGLLFLRAQHLGYFALNEKLTAKLINEQYKQYQESADLLLESENDLSSLQQLQQSRTLDEFRNNYNAIRFPDNLLRTFFGFAIVLTASIGLKYFIPEKSHRGSDTVQSTASEMPKESLPPSIDRAEIVVVSPSYTGIKNLTTEQLNISVAEGSKLSWNVRFNGGPGFARLRISGADSVSLELEDGKNGFIAEYKASESFIYQFTWKDKAGKQFSSDYYKIEVLKDNSPTINMGNLPQFNTVTLSEQSSINLNATLSDDYGLSDAHIVATVSKGSGEAIKFREEKLFFTSPAKIQGKTIQAKRNIDLKKLGMGPGDELYFYIEGFDNKVPLANKTRTETYFIAVKDTASQELSVDAGLGVDLMPEYFRSQRQIIIDTEKLLRNRKKMSVKEFKETSNELGYDQKVLRLKYGEFLGEEFESGIGGSAMGGEAAQTIEEAVKQYGHTHDTENEHNLVEDKKAPAKDTHHHGEEGKEESPLEAFAHNHDNAEEATFFVLSVKAKLKAALAVMWDAELYLRVYDPKKSLPFQYEALRLLKEISNDSRVYVHRTGFDPPPIKEESRLKGDLNETKSTTDSHTIELTEKYPAITKSLQIISGMLDKKTTTIPPASKAILQQGGNELSAVALTKPGEFFKSLSVLQQLIEGRIPKEKTEAALIEIQKALWEIIPPSSLTPAAHEQVLHELDRRFIDNLTND